MDAPIPAAVRLDMARTWLRLAKEGLDGSALAEVEAAMRCTEAALMDIQAAAPPAAAFHASTASAVMDRRMRLRAVTLMLREYDGTPHLAAAAVEAASIRRWVQVHDARQRRRGMAS